MSYPDTLMEDIVSIMDSYFPNEDTEEVTELLLQAVLNYYEND